MQRWDDTLWLFTEAEFKRLPDGIVLTSISGDTVTKGVDYINQDTRFGLIAFGIKNPTTHPEAELFSIFMLER